MKKEQLSILYDISVLGMGHFSHTARTGVFRLTENLFNNLMLSNSIYNMKWIASRCNYFQCCEYLKARDYRFINNKKVFPSYHYYWDRKAEKYSHFKPLRKLFKGSRCLFKSWSNEFIRSKAEDVDIFHSTYFAIPQPIVSNPNIIRFLTVYDMIPYLFPQFFTKKIIGQVKNAIDSLTPKDFVICISESTRDDFCNLTKFDASRVFVIPLAAGDSFYPCRDARVIANIKNKYQIPEGHYVLSVATLEPRKNLKQLITSYLQVVEQEKADDLHLVLIGAKSSLYNRLFSDIKIPSWLRDRIIFTGYVPDCDLTPLYSGALGFAYLSFYEGFGLPPLEAMKCGTPVITSNTSSLPEVVGDAGIMASPEDGDSISRAILDLYCSESIRSQLSTKSIQRAKLFSWEKCFHQTTEAYKTAIIMNQ